MGRDGRIALVNASAEQLLGARAVELQGLCTEEMVPERHRARHVELRERYFAEPWKPKGASGSLMKVLDWTGRERNVFARPEPIASEDGLWVSIAFYLADEPGDVEGSALRASSSTPATA